MNFIQADSIGRELAWINLRQMGVIDDEMVKQGGLLEGLIYAPLSAIAAAITAPMGSKIRSAALGLLLGAGVASTASKEVQNKTEKGEPVDHKQMGAAMQAIFAGISTGGAARVVKDLKEGKEVGTAGAIMASAPIGAMLMSTNPVVGALTAGAGAAVAAALRGGSTLPMQSPDSKRVAYTSEPDVHADLQNLTSEEISKRVSALQPPQSDLRALLH